jgi:hypothetical protein
LCEIPIPESYKTNTSVTDGGGKGVAASSASSPPPPTSPAAANNSSIAAAADESVSELICLESEVLELKLDGFSLDDINDDDFNPRASDEDDEDEDAAQFDPRAPPLAPVPQVAVLSPPALPPRVANNNSQNLTSTPKMDNIFSSNPFSNASDPFGMSAFDSAQSGAQPKTGMSALERPPFVAGLAAGGGGGGGSAGQNFFDELDPLKK